MSSKGKNLSFGVKPTAAQRAAMADDWVKSHSEKLGDTPSPAPAPAAPDTPPPAPPVTQPPVTPVVSDPDPAPVPVPEPAPAKVVPAPAIAASPAPSATLVQAAPAADVKLKRLTLDIPPELHTRIKMACAKRGTKMVEEIKALLDAHYREA